MIVEKMPPKKEDKKKQLKDVKPGSVIRFPETPMEEILTSDDPAVYLVVEDKANPADRVSLVPMSGKGGIIKRDADRMVVQLNAKMLLGEAL